MSGYDELIEALKIFKAHSDDPGRKRVTHCEHDTLYVVGKYDLPDEAKARLDELGFGESEGGWMSYRFGSA